MIGKIGMTKRKEALDSWLLKITCLCMTYEWLCVQSCPSSCFCIYFIFQELLSHLRDEDSGSTEALRHSFKPTLDFSFSIWCSTSSVSSVFSRRSYATLLVPFIRFKGSTDIPYAWKREQIHHGDQMTHIACASTHTDKRTSLLSKRAAHNIPRADRIVLRLSFISFLCGVKICAICNCSKLYWRSRCNHFMWVPLHHVTLIQFTA